MANWYGSARTNYVHLADEAGFRAVAKRLSMTVMTSPEGLFGLHPGDYSDDEDWPTWVLREDEEDEEIEFSFEEHIMPFVAEGQVLVTISVGAEKLRYLSGHANAYVRKGDKVKVVTFSLNDIYKAAAEELELFTTLAPITEASY